MKPVLYAIAIVGLAASPALADMNVESMTCGQFANLNSENQIAAFGKLEPKSVEPSVAAPKGDGTTASTGAGGTVDPQLTENQKVGRLLDACGGDSDMMLKAAAAKMSAG